MSLDAGETAFKRGFSTDVDGDAYRTARRQRRRQHARALGEEVEGQGTSHGLHGGFICLLSERHVRP